MHRNTPSLPPPRSPASVAAAAMSGFNAAYAASAGQQLSLIEPQKDLLAACNDISPEEKKSFYNQNLLMFYPPYGIITFIIFFFLCLPCFCLLAVAVVIIVVILVVIVVALSLSLSLLLFN